MPQCRARSSKATVLHRGTWGSGLIGEASFFRTRSMRDFGSGPPAGLSDTEQGAGCSRRRMQLELGLAVYCGRLTRRLPKSGVRLRDSALPATLHVARPVWCVACCVLRVALYILRVALRRRWSCKETNGWKTRRWYRTQCTDGVLTGTHRVPTPPPLVSAAAIARRRPGRC